MTNTLEGWEKEFDKQVDNPLRWLTYGDLGLSQKEKEIKLFREGVEDGYTHTLDEMASLFAQMQFELADVRKSKAIYFVENKLDSDKATERAWQATSDGLREIELSHYSKGTEKLLSSLKSRLYNLY